MSGRVRVVVVEDSLTVRRRLVEVLEAEPDVDVVGEAVDAREAIDAIERLRPDVVSLDLVLAGGSGLEVTEHVMAYCPTPILVVSSAENRGEAHRTLDALAAGAVDVLDKDGDWEARYVAALKRVARIRVITHPRARLDRGREQARAAPRHTDGGAPKRARAGLVDPAERGSQDDGSPREAGERSRRTHPADGPRREVRAVAIGASTGGPAALARMLGALPPDFPAPLLLVVHISAPFAATFVDWLDGLSRLPVRFAADDAPLPRAGEPGVLVAPADRHLVLRGGRLHLTDEPERHSCRPSVDVLFESVAESLGPSAVGCLLTGMGRDGAVGLKAIRAAGGATIAQDEASSIVYGMPREAVLLGAAEQVLPLEQIAAALEALVS